MSNDLLFEGRDLEEVLSEAQLVFGPEVEIAAANRVRKGGVFGFFAREWYEVWAHGPASTMANPAVALLDREIETDELDTFQSMVTNALAAQTTPDRLDNAMDQFFGPDDGPAGGGRGGQSSGPTTNADIVSVPAGGVAVAERVEEAAPEPAPTTPAMVALEDPPRGATVFDTPRTIRTDLLWAVLERIESMAAVVELPEQGIVTFIGDASVAVPIVQDIGRRTGQWGSDVAVVSNRSFDDVPSWLAINDLQDLGGRAPRWRRREGLVPVIIDNSLEKPNLGWVGEALDVLEPAQTRLVAEAWRLPEQVGRLAVRLGGVDGLELAQAGDTIDPLAMLDLEIPIGSVEGRPASVELLAAVWLDRRRRG